MAAKMNHGRGLHSPAAAFVRLPSQLAKALTFNYLGRIKFGVPPATRAPTFVAAATYTVEDMPTEAEQRALAKRGEWMKNSFGDFTKALAQMSEPDLSSLRKKIETDESLVHAAYYTDDECIERIADWIAGKQRVIEAKNDSLAAV